MPAVFIKTLGCKVNNYDAMALMGRFAALGYSVADSTAEADIIILNTCSVTQNADREARYLIRKMHRERPEALLVATGCYAQTNPGELAEIEHLHGVIPQSRKESLAETVDQMYRTKQGADREGHEPCQQEEPQPNRVPAPLTLEALDSKQTRAYLRIQDGCESYCSYCIIPYARGRIRSVPAAAIVAEAARLDTAGVREIVLAGIHLGQYGRDLNPKTPYGEQLSALVGELATSALPHARIRVSSLEPMELATSLIQLAATHPKQICPHFHLPLQSGCDRILKLMNRPYKAADYLAKARELHEMVAGVNITTDVIVGFPSETDDEFAATCRLIADAGITKVHVFPFSARQGTPAAKLTEAVDPAVIASRAALLREQSDRQEAAYRESNVGHSLDALWEESFNDNGRRVGRTQNYLEVILDGAPDEPRGTLTRLSVTGIDRDGFLVGRMAPA